MILLGSRNTSLEILQLCTLLRLLKLATEVVSFVKKLCKFTRGGGWPWYIIKIVIVICYPFQERKIHVVISQQIKKYKQKNCNKNVEKNIHHFKKISISTNKIYCTSMNIASQSA